MPRKPMGCIGFIIATTKWLPVLVTCAIFTWGWYAYTFHLTIFTPNGRIPSKFYLTPEVSEEFTKAPSDQLKEDILVYVVKRNDLPVSCRTYSGGIRYCEKCNLIKPDRCHHCSICGICILKMDHHCPWINNCVSFTNYKFFVLFLGYTFAECVFVAATTFPYFLRFWIPPDNQPMYKPATNNTAFEPPSMQELPNNNIGFNNYQNIINNMSGPNSISYSTKFHILFLFFVSAMLSFGVMFLYCYHVYLLLNNRSTLESFRPPLMTYGPDRNAFNLGRRENLMQLFGRSKLLWMVPIFTTEGSGLTYDQRPQLGHADEEVRQELLNHNHAQQSLPQSNTNNLVTQENGDTEV